MKKLNLNSSKLMGYKMAASLQAKVGQPKDVMTNTVVSSKLGGKLGMKRIV